MVSVGIKYEYRVHSRDWSSILIWRYMSRVQQLPQGWISTTPERTAYGIDPHSNLAVDRQTNNHGEYSILTDYL